MTVVAYRVSNDLKPPLEDDWPLLMRRCRMDEAQQQFYRAMWYAAGVAWARGLAVEALAAVCNVTAQE